MSFVVNELFQRMGGLGGSPRRRGSGRHDKAKKTAISSLSDYGCFFFATRDCSEGKAFPSFILTNYFPEFQFALKMHRANAL